MRLPRLRTPSLDFIVIGAQKAGTTALWRYLEDNPALGLPASKEAEFFSISAYPSGLRPYMRGLAKYAPARAKLGTVTPEYMLGTPVAPPRVIADRIRETFPEVRLVALLRDPVERARSHHRMSSRRGIEPRSFDDAVAELLHPAELDRARSGPSETNAYIAGGEYGRILADYLERFPREQLLIELTDDLEREPDAVIRRVCEFVGVKPHDPARLGRRFHVSGSRPLIPPDAEAELKHHLRRNAWSLMRHSAAHEEWFAKWFDMWNIQPDENPPEKVDPNIDARLRDHFAPDADLLERITGVQAPWVRRG